MPMTPAIAAKRVEQLFSTLRAHASSAVHKASRAPRKIQYSPNTQSSCQPQARGAKLRWSPLADRRNEGENATFSTRRTAAWPGSRQRMGWALIHVKAQPPSLPS